MKCCQSYFSEQYYRCNQPDIYTFLNHPVRRNHLPTEHYFLKQQENLYLLNHPELLTSRLLTHFSHYQLHIRIFFYPKYTKNQIFLLNRLLLYLKKYYPLLLYQTPVSFHIGLLLLRSLHQAHPNNTACLSNCMKI